MIISRGGGGARCVDSVKPRGGEKKKYMELGLHTARSDIPLLLAFSQTTATALRYCSLDETTASVTIPQRGPLSAELPQTQLALNDNGPFKITVCRLRLL